MKKLIRTGVFETNSSSTHSISIADSTKQFVFDSIYPDTNGVVTLTGGEYGWNWFKTNEALEKANYAAQSLFGDYDNLIEVIKEQTGANEVVIDLTTDGYIDHQSVGIVENNKEWLRNFIFNKNSWLFGGNDNSSPDPTFYVVNEFKDGLEIAPTFKYKLVIDKTSKTTKFLDKPTKTEIIKAVDAVLGDCVLYEYGDITERNMYMMINDWGKYYKCSSWGKETTVNEDEMGGTAYFVKDDELNRKVREIVDAMPNKNEVTWKERESISDKLCESDEYCRSVNFRIVQLG